MQNILITGGTGFIGKYLIKHLLDHFPECHITVLIRTRKNELEADRIHYCLWDALGNDNNSEISNNIDTVFHLAGANIAEKRWTSKRKKDLIDSRIQTASTLIHWILNKGKNVQTFISASGIGYYGETKSTKPFTEDDPAAKDFLGKLCLDWELVTQPLVEKNIRVVNIRTGLVMHPDGGMWQQLQTAFRFHIVPIFGIGKQIYSWISLPDLINIYSLSGIDKNIVGPINAVAPYPTSQKILTQTLALQNTSKTLNLKLPAFLLKLVLGELSQELLKSANVSCEKIEKLGYIFEYPTINDVIEKN